MNQVQAEKYNIAWFRLAECISRREKERALGVYRLLSHSFDNAAIGYQLEGDILLAFNDISNAILLYEKAAHAYEAQGQLMQAVAVYDHLFTLQQKADYLEAVVALYAQLKNPRIFSYIKHLCHLFLQQNNIKQMLELLQRFEMNMAQKALLMTEITLAAFKDQRIERQSKLHLMRETIDRVMYDTQQLRQFLMHIKMLDEQAYATACAYIQS